MFTAVMYVWPATPWLQLRAGVCVLAVASMRLLNLAVPILYRNVVNELSRASNDAHPEHEQQPIYTTFGKVEGLPPYATNRPGMCHLL